MSWGDASRGGHQWVLDEDAGRAIIKDALEAGINFFDTANVYSAGSSEEFTGRALKDFARREDVVLATKVHGRMRPGPNGAGLSRKAILHEIDASLKRLGTDYVDLYQIHRWDDTTPIEETMEALHDVVQAGKARYIGASSMYAWQFSKAQHVADLAGWTRFVSMQNHYNLLYREEEREMLPLCADQGVGVIPWSPLARGRLTRDWDADTARSETDGFGGTLYKDEDQAIVETVAAVASRLDVPRAQVALAWLLHQPTVTSPIIGVTKPQHLERRRRGRRPGAGRRRPRGARRRLHPARRRRPPLDRRRPLVEVPEREPRPRNLVRYAQRCGGFEALALRARAPQPAGGGSAGEHDLHGGPARHVAGVVQRDAGGVRRQGVRVGHAVPAAVVGGHDRVPGPAVRGDRRQQLVEVLLERAVVAAVVGHLDHVHRPQRALLVHPPPRRELRVAGQQQPPARATRSRPPRWCCCWPRRSP